MNCAVVQPPAPTNQLRHHCCCLVCQYRHCCQCPTVSPVIRLASRGSLYPFLVSPSEICGICVCHSRLVDKLCCHPDPLSCHPPAIHSCQVGHHHEEPPCLAY